MNNRYHKLDHSLALWFFIILLAGATSELAQAQTVQTNPPELRGIDVEEHLGNRIPLDLTFINDQGETESIGRYFNQGKPVVLIMAYYECPMLCTLVLNGLAFGVNQLGWTPGEEFQILTVSINPVETHELAAAKKTNLLRTLDKKGIENGWRFFVGSEDQVKALADAIGFKYYYDEHQKQFAHPAVATILTSDGRVSRYLYGVEFKKQDLRLALLEASEGKIGSTIDRIILYCFHYDPNARGYVPFATNIMKLGGLMTLVAMGALLSVFWVREHRRKSAHAVIT